MVDKKNILCKFNIFFVLFMVFIVVNIKCDVVVNLEIFLKIKKYYILKYMVIVEWKKSGLVMFLFNYEISVEKIFINI